MGVEIKPEPTLEERAAILRALAQLNGHEQPSEWWRAGVRESLGEDDKD
jgi:hypothetical protein